MSYSKDGQRWWRRVGRGQKGQVIDGPSGLPGRHWLNVQVCELEERSQNDRAPIAVLVFHIADHDLATEEELADVASRMQARLRAYERLFRVGSRDFVFLVPGANSEKGREIGQRLRARVGEIPMWRGGTMQLHCGVSASDEGEPFTFELVAAKASRALERAGERGGVVLVERVSPGDGLHVVGEASRSHQEKGTRSETGGDPPPSRSPR